jgi:hypothetical protein
VRAAVERAGTFTASEVSTEHATVIGLGASMSGAPPAVDTPWLENTGRIASTVGSVMGTKNRNGIAVSVPLEADVERAVRPQPDRDRHRPLTDRQASQRASRLE